MFLYVYISFDPVPMEARTGRRERPSVAGQGTQVRRTPIPSQPSQDLGGTAETENSEELPRYESELHDNKAAIKKNKKNHIH